MKFGKTIVMFAVVLGGLALSHFAQASAIKTFREKASFRAEYEHRFIEADRSLLKGQPASAQMLSVKLTFPVKRASFFASFGEDVKAQTYESRVGVGFRLL